MNNKDFFSESMQIFYKVCSVFLRRYGQYYLHLFSKSNRIWLFLSLLKTSSLLLFFIGVLGCKQEGNLTSRSTSTIKRIAHAGGGYNNQTYTNSLNALQENQEYYNLFELDFMFTLDEELVCIHDWEVSSLATFGKKFDIPPTYKEFIQLVEHNEKYKNCTLETLVEWLMSTPNARIVTDVKDDNIKALTYIAARHKNFLDRFVPQIYAPEEYLPVTKLGFNSVIFTLYRYAGSNEQILKEVERMKLYAVTMPKERVEMLAPLLKAAHIPTYVHTINSQEEMEHFKHLGITEIYTDWLREKN